ncbi:hypothetical protein [Bacterioplanoides sp.]
MKLFRKTLSAIFLILVLLSLLAMVFQGFQLIPAVLATGWLITAAALHSIGGKPGRIIGYVASLGVIGAFGLVMQISMTLEPNSHDAFGGFVVSSAGILLGLLAAVGIYSAAREEKQSAAAS